MIVIVHVTPPTAEPVHRVTVRFPGGMLATLENAHVPPFGAPLIVRRSSHLHPLILFDASDPEEIRKAEEFGGKILELSVEVGGCITGEHGVGVEKLRQMPSQFSPQELLQFEEIKYAFDPQLTLNPGKGIPILKRCQEYRALPARHQHD